MTYLVTHIRPDWDALTSVWLLRRFAFESNVPVVFVSQRDPDPNVLAGALGVVDVGRELDLSHWRADHHQLPGLQSTSTSATRIVFNRLLMQGAEIAYLQSLIDLIDHADRGLRTPDVAQSRTLGIHALLSTRLRREVDDWMLLAWGCNMLDDLASGLLARSQASDDLTRHTVWASDDGRVRALLAGSSLTSQAAYDDGAALVVFANDPHPATGSIAVGLTAAPGSGIHTGSLVLAVLGSPDSDPEIRAELRTWFRHEAGWLSCRGTSGAPDLRPLTVSVAEIAQAIDAVYVRSRLPEVV